MSTSTTPMATAPKARETFGSATHGSAGASPLVLAAFAAVYVIWGSTYLAIRVGVETIPPLMLAGLRHFTVGLLLYPILRWRTHVRPTAANWKSAAVTGCLLLFVGNGGVSWAEQIVPSGITALLVTMEGTICSAQLTPPLPTNSNRQPVTAADFQFAAVGRTRVLQRRMG